MIPRRTLIRSTALSLAGAAITRPARAVGVERFQELPTARDERLKMLITTAVDAAMVTGAKYADARLTFTQEMSINGDGFNSVYRTGGLVRRNEQMQFGVRAQYDGYWGFASSPVWTKEEAARLGRVAVTNAKANVLGQQRDVEMALNPGATSGDWSMPVVDDPFAMDPEEIYDYLSGLQLYMFRLGSLGKNLGLVFQVASRGNFFRQQKAFGSSDGQFVTQRVYRTQGVFGFTVMDDPPNRTARRASGQLEQISEAGAGFEYLRHAQVREWTRRLYEEVAEERYLPIVPADVGRYLTLIPPTGVAQLVKKSVGVATEIDRVMGYEANATGTSYIVDPDEALGSLKIGAPIMHVTGTRSVPGGLAHVKWDDEGVAPQDISLVQQGVLTNLQTNREGASWIRKYSRKNGQSVHSSGCAYAADASDSQVVHPADLMLHPDPERDTTLAQLRAQMDKGIELKGVVGATLSMDFQQSTGLFLSQAFEVKKGKRVARIPTVGMLFRTPELWENLEALGGKHSVLQTGTRDMKGESFQFGFSSVSAPPGVFKEMSIINPRQKA